MQTGPSAAGSVQGHVPYGPVTVGGSERVDNSNAVPLDSWMQEYAATHGGRLPRAVLVDRFERPSDRVIVEHYRYVTPDEARVIYIAPEDARAVYRAPEEPRVIYVAPPETGVTYVVPGESRVIYRMRGAWVPESDFVLPPGGMQATPGADGPASPKGE
jgi:hypothetical protein